MSWDDFLNGFYQAGQTFFDFIFNVILTLVLALTMLIITPIAALVEVFIPAVNDMLQWILSFMAFIELILGRALDIALIFIPQPVITFYMSYLVALVTVPWGFWAVNKLVAWYNRLKF